MSTTAPSASLNRNQRRTALERLATERYDVIVVGGGVTGASCPVLPAPRAARAGVVDDGAGCGRTGALPCAPPYRSPSPGWSRDEEEIP